ncbi:hypothetical protein [Nostoc sp. DedSLP04]|uniref:hypothetical protein n=1 Tax=Nostoc sp. DedSLP04 TaxID=3075401 RepID=UPI002AD59CAE|nr:hypothetical protein [Nostoc sp. DedSLP04]MDZ8030408.1 hypothetical protein [Nostoc sp. DedSLP04]
MVGCVRTWGNAPLYSLRGTVIHYEDPFEPTVPIKDWEVLQQFKLLLRSRSVS